MLAFGSWISRLTLRGRFPLLLKELTEMAARRRTYVVRVIYAVLLFGIYGLILKETLGHLGGGSTYGIMGRGRGVFMGATAPQFVGLFLFLPAMMSTAITGEKERDTLPLILLTDLRPWEIVLEKYIGRMVPMAVFLLLGMPLVALAYSLGGVSLGQIVLVTYFLFLTMMQVGAMSLMISAWCRTSVSAFIASYVGLLVLYAGPPGIFDVVFGMGRMGLRIALVLCPPLTMQREMGVWASVGGRAAPGGDLALSAGLLLRLALVSLPALLSIALFLGMARRYLVRRASVPPGNALRGYLRWLDRAFLCVNARLGGVIVAHDRASLPASKPVFWRETTSKALGKFSYLLRILLFMEVALFITCNLLSRNEGEQYYGRDDQFRRFSFLLYVLWIFGALALVVRGADAIPSERSSQTLEPLLATPMDSREIIGEKMRAIRRMAVVIGLGLLTVIAKQAYERHTSGDEYGLHGGEYFLRASLIVLVHLPMLYWLGLFIGGRMRSRAKAISVSLVVLTAWCVVPFFLAFLLSRLVELDIERQLVLYLIVLASPVSMIGLVESGGLPDHARSALALGVLAYAVVAIMLRAWCLRHADGILGRPSTAPRRLARSGMMPAGGNA